MNEQKETTSEPGTDPQGRLEALVGAHDEPACHAGMDGECYWIGCPQLRDGEPEKSGRSCPLPHLTDDPEY